MRTLIEKEVRLLLPAFAAALVLAIVPVWLLPVDPRNPGAVAGWFYLFGAVMLGLCTFGREIALKTVPFMLAQPLARSRVWWTKIVVLGSCGALTYGAWWLSGSVSSMLRSARSVQPEALGLVALTVAVMTAGGLWLTLLLRQTVAAFCLALLTPWAVIVGVAELGGADWIIFSTLGFYAVATFLLAWRQFLQMQDTAWTGGIIALGWNRAIAAGPGPRERAPFPSLLLKELRLHEFTLAAMAVLFVLNLAAKALQKVGAHAFSQTTLSALTLFGAVWVFLALVAGTQSVAEERQLGVLEGLLCLPASRRAQFWTKLALVLVLGGLICPALLCAVEWIGGAFGVSDKLFPLQAFPYVVYIFLAISLLGFYASTLTRSGVQAIAAGVVAIVLLWMMADVSVQPAAGEAFGTRLLPVTAIPVLIATILWLSYGNFKCVFESGRRWRHNITAPVTVSALICGAVAGVHQRIWEWATPLDGAHGPARLPTRKPVLLRGNGGTGLAVLLPDGRLWTDCLEYYDGWASLGGNRFVPGSDWLDACTDFRETVVIRTDGTLWVSAKLRPPLRDIRHPPLDESAQLVQFGTESNWQSVQLFPTLLLKRDGTLWSWGNVDIDRNYKGLHALTLQRADTDSDWALVMRGGHWTYAWKRDGTAWVLLPETFNRMPIRSWFHVSLKSLDNLRFRSLNSYPSLPDTEVGLRDDGTLWYWTWRESGAVSKGNVEEWNWYSQQSLRTSQIGNDSNWAAITGGANQLVAMKTDGSLWKWDLRRGRWWESGGAVQAAPRRLGSHDDWIGLGCWLTDPVALAADGSLWCLAPMPTPAGWSDEDSEAWLAPSRRFSKIENILAHE
jgi:ABC-type transport system involved in multi-copper enzyme maturation permease subunit